MDNNVIHTGLGNFSKDKFDALVNVRSTALKALREVLEHQGYTEVTTSTLVNIAGSCENPHASFTLNYYGREAHLSQSAQIQLEKLVIGLKRGVFTINNSFREENYDDPEARGRRLSEFTLVEPERPYEGLTPEKALDKLIEEQTAVIKYSSQKVVEQCALDIKRLHGDVDYLKKIITAGFERITYDEARDILNKNRGTHTFGDDFGVLEEREILKYFNGIPTFVTYYPAAIKFFNMKRTPDGQRVYNVDLLTPKLGETSGGAVREEDGEIIKQHLRESRIGAYLRERGQDPVHSFTDYFDVFAQKNPFLRGGYGIGFERFVGFLLQSNDILDTVAYRTLNPYEELS